MASADIAEPGIKADSPRRSPDVGRAPPGSDVERKLAQIWESPPGWRGWLSTVDHKAIGLRYIVTAFFSDNRGGRSAAHTIQLARPDLTLLTPEQYNQLFTMHGMTMIFLYALPILSGFSNYLWPLLLGSRDMAFPRLNALSYWIFLFAGIFMYASFPLGQAPNGGWFNYVPFSGPIYNTGPNIDVFALGMVLARNIDIRRISKFCGYAVQNASAPGMTINRVPILVWGTLTASVANLLAIPSVSLAFFLLWLDRQIGTHFFDVANGGKPLLWQHLFWIFGHPWVYAIVLPAMGIVSDALADILPPPAGGLCRDGAGHHGNNASRF